MVEKNYHLEIMEKNRVSFCASDLMDCKPF